MPRGDLAAADAITILRIQGNLATGGQDGKAEDVCRVRLRASAVLEKLGLPRGPVFRRQGNADTLPDVTWLMEYPDEAAAGGV